MAAAAPATKQHHQPTLLEDRANTSTRIFRQFLTVDEANGAIIDAERINSTECFDLWVLSRKARPQYPEKAFQRALSCHLTGVDGRLPFSPEEEQAILRVVRRKVVWPCFANSKFGFGVNGFRSKGFHEQRSAPPPPPPAATTAVAAAEEEAQPLVLKQKPSPPVPAPLPPPPAPAPATTSTRALVDEDQEMPPSSSFATTVHQTLLRRLSALIPTTALEPSPPTPTPPTPKRTRLLPLPPPSPPLSHHAAPPPPAQFDDTQHRELMRTHHGETIQFQHMSMSLLQRYELQGSDGWEPLLDMSKFYLLGLYDQARVHASTSSSSSSSLTTTTLAALNHDATRATKMRALFDQACANFPHEAVLIMDPLARHVRERIVYQNPISVQVMGPIAEGECRRKLFDSRDNWRALTTGVQAGLNPGADVLVTLRVHYAHQPTAWSTVFVRHDPETWVFVIRGFLPMPLT